VEVANEVAAVIRVQVLVQQVAVVVVVAVVQDHLQINIYMIIMYF
jgi:hypothetical protein